MNLPWSREPSCSSVGTKAKREFWKQWGTNSSKAKVRERRSLALLPSTPLHAYAVHCIGSPNPYPLLSLHSSFTPNLKHCSSTNPSLTCPLLPPSHLNSKHHPS